MIARRIYILRKFIKYNLKIGLRCLVELNELLLNTQKIVSPTESPKTGIVFWITNL